MEHHAILRACGHCQDLAALVLIVRDELDDGIVEIEIGIAIDIFEGERPGHLVVVVGGGLDVGDDDVRAKHLDVG